jgi:hypothetical protein
MQSTMSPTHNFHESDHAQVMNHLCQVVPGDMVRVAYVVNDDKPVAVQCQLDQCTQRVIGMGSQSHGDVPCPEYGPGKNPRILPLDAAARTHGAAGTSMHHADCHGAYPA